MMAKIVVVRRLQCGVQTAKSRFDSVSVEAHNRPGDG